MRRVASALSYANVVSTVCLFIVLGGGAYAATKLPRTSDMREDGAFYILLSS